MDSPEVIEITDGDWAVHVYRHDELLRLGFSVGESDRFASMHWHQFDVAVARRLLQLGATHLQVIRLLAP